MATNRTIHGKVVLKVETEGESAALAKLRSRFKTVTAKVGVEGSFSRAQLQKALTAEASKGRGLRVNVEANFSRAQVQRALKLATAAKPPRITVHVDIKRGSYKTIISDAKRAQKEVTSVEKRALDQRETNLQKSRQRESTILAKGQQDRLTAEQRTINRIRLLEEQAANINLRNQQASALRREVIQAQMFARLTAQDNAFQQRRIIAEERVQRQLQARANKPIIQKFLIQGDKINASLADFDRTVSRALKTSLGAFTAWAAGVEIAFGIAAAAGVAAFAQLEQASTRAAAVVASQQRVNEIQKYGKAITDFSNVTADARLKIEGVAQKVALKTLFDPTEIAAGIQSLLQSGQSLEEAFVNIGSAANFATVNNQDLQETSDGLATALASAGLSANESALLLDKISLTAADAVGNVDDYFKAFANGAAASGRIIGATTDETLFVLRLLGQSGKLGLEAGTSADIIFRDLGRAANKAGAAWEKYGLSVNGTVSEQLVGLAEVIDKTGENRLAQAKLRSELGFQEKSFRAIARIIPQISELGGTTEERLAAVNRELATTAKGANGLVGLQLGELRKNVAFQFDQLLDSFKIAFQEFGRGAADEVSDLFDVFAGTGGLIDQALPALREFGRQFGEVIGDIAQFVKTPAFRDGIDNLVEAVQITLDGVGEAFAVFSAAFGRASENQSVFESVTESIRAFAQVTATVLPVVAKILGSIFDFLIDHADAFETFAKLTLAIFALRKAYSLLIKPVGEAVLAMNAFVGALRLAAATGAGGVIINGLAAIATRFGILTAATTASTVAIDANTAAMIANNRAALAGSLVPGVGGTAAKSASKSAGTLVFAGTRLEGFARTLPRLASVLGRLGLAFARVAGPIGLVVLAITGAIGILRGFVAGFRDTIRQSPEIEASISRVGAAFKVLYDKLVLVLDIADQFFFAIGEKLGSATAKSIAALGDFIEVIDRLLHLDFEEAGNAAVRMIKDIGGAAGDAAQVLAFLIPGGQNTALAAEQLRTSMNGVEQATTKAKVATQGYTDAQLAASISTSELAFQEQVAARVISLSSTRSLEAATKRNAALATSVVFTKKAEAATEDLLGTVGGISPTFIGLQASGVSALDKIRSAAALTTSELLSMQAALQAGLGQSLNATESLIDAGLQASLSSARAGKGPFTEKQIQGQINSNNERRRREALVRNARKARRDAQIIEDALGDGEDAPLTTGGSSGGSVASFADPDEAIRRQIDALKPAQKAAETSAIIAKALKSGEKGYAATRREVGLLEDALPGLDKAIESQRTEVEKLDQALQGLRDTQLEGTKAFSDQSFAIEQQVKQLQLNKLDLQIGGAADGDPALTALDDQISALQQQAERASLVESLQLDPLRRQLEQTFNPQVESSFGSIVEQFKALTAQRELANEKLGASERMQRLISEAAEAGSAKFGKLDAAAQAAQSSLASASSSAGVAATAISGVSDSASAGARSVNRYSSAIENVPSGATVVDRSLTKINERVTEVAPQLQAAGKRIQVVFTRGINQGAEETYYPTLATIVGNTLTYFRTLYAPATAIGKRVMDSFLDGIKQGFGTPEDVGSVAWYLNVFIPDWIRENKGPVAYDATILVPAGHAVMDGFGKGLRQGFSQIQSFVKDVGPSLSEFISSDAFDGRTATVMADIAVGKTPDIDALFGDLKQQNVGYGAGGQIDPSLSYLHPSLSYEDTKLMAETLSKQFGLAITSMRFDHSKYTVDGNVSSHGLGLAADLSNGSRPTPQMDALHAATTPLLGKVFDQILYKTLVGGNHFNHVHLDWIADKKFSIDSGKIGAPAFTDIPGASNIVDQAINAAARKYDIELAVLAGLYKQESSFNPNVISSDGGYGLAQLTSPGLLKQVGFNRLDPFRNADVGARYLKGFLEHNSVADSVGLYNAGSKPFPASTRNVHIPNVMRNIEEFRRIFGSGRFGGFREMGGGVRANDWHVVGEKGPEIFTPSTSGTIIPAGDTARIMGGAGGNGVTYHDNRNIQVTTAATDAEAVAALIESKTRTKFTGVNFR